VPPQARFWPCANAPDVSVAAATSFCPQEIAAIDCLLVAFVRTDLDWVLVFRFAAHSTRPFLIN
jgi:hypothetical protein